MKVLILGATGNLGVRLIPAMLSHNLSVIAFVRSSSKLSSLLPPAIFEQVTVVEGNAKSVDSVKNAILDHDCDAVVNTAGLAAMMPWNSSDLPEIVRTVVRAAKEAGEVRHKPLRLWLLGGMGLMDVPGTKSMIVRYMPIFREHIEDLALLNTIPATVVRWSILCPAYMIPRSTELKGASSGRLATSATVPPHWNDFWFRRLPVVGPFFVVLANASKYTTTLEDNADFIANDVAADSDEYVCKKVGVFDPAGGKA
ncbi:hypothetical protein V1525DRAFT_412438 [Lipomyces kononenkoae]|uniref:Uncharacterized protein n=1 Tax=Lipomyces kononenkoae TaxID=34357 RepID=A0ACC3SST5_LIPKO